MRIYACQCLLASFQNITQDEKFPTNFGTKVERYVVRTSPAASYSPAWILPLDSFSMIKAQP